MGDWEYKAGTRFVVLTNADDACRIAIRVDSITSFREVSIMVNRGGRVIDVSGGDKGCYIFQYDNEDPIEVTESFETISNLIKGE